MTVLHLADEGEAADLAAFLSRLLHYDRGAAVRLQGAGTALAVFGRPPSFEVLAVRAVRLAKPYEDGLDVTLDVTVSAGELLESVDELPLVVDLMACHHGPLLEVLLRAEQEVDTGLLQIAEEHHVVDVAVRVHVRPAQRAAVDVPQDQPRVSFL